MKQSGRSAVAIATVMALAAGSAAAQESHTIRFPAGSSSTTVKGALKGDSYVDYRIGARAGQSMDVVLKPETVFFNVLAPGSTGEAMFIGSGGGSEFGGTLPSSGIYTIRVYQMGAAASEGKFRRFTLEIGID